VDFDTAINILNKLLRKKDPDSFSPSWILKHAPAVYRYIHRNVRTENDEIDWDAVTLGLKKDFQERWHGKRRRTKKPYKSKSEVNAVLKKYQDKLYVFVAAESVEDKLLRDRLTVALVRLAQKGNKLAEQHVVMLARPTVDDWVEKRFVLNRWADYCEEIDVKIAGCVRRYRYTGSFYGYVFKTLYCCARYLRYNYSLDKEVFPGVTMADSLVQDAETGELRMYDRSYPTELP
jgi:hypothetical protein